MADYTYLVPTDTKRVLQQRSDVCLNMGLVLARYIPHEAIRNDDLYDDRGKATGKVRTEWLIDTLQRFTRSNLSDLLNANFERWIALTTTTHAPFFEMRAMGRVIIGLGGKGPLEFGITLHAVTGLPYIPGSALKGVCRSYALLSIAETLGVKIDTAELSELDETLLKGKHDTALAKAIHYRQVFGSQDEAGGCVFYDGILSDIPMEMPIFTLEVMTPHYGDYYTTNGGKSPDDGGDPKPVNFLTVTEGVKFAFAIGKRTHFANDATVKQARRWLRDGLQELGIGAKTASGYGVFELDRS